MYTSNCWFILNLEKCPKYQKYKSFNTLFCCYYKERDKLTEYISHLFRIKQDVDIYIGKVYKVVRGQTISNDGCTYLGSLGITTQTNL